MSDQTTAEFVGQDAGQQTASSDQPQNVTLTADVVKKIVEESVEKRFKGIQNYVDVSVAKQNQAQRDEIKRIDAMLSDLRGRGQAIPPEVEMAMKNDALSKLADSGQASSQVPAQEPVKETPTQNAPKSVDEVRSETNRRLAEAGLTPDVLYNSPYKAILKIEGTPEEYLATLDAFITLEGQSPSRPSGNPAAVPSLEARGGAGSSLEAEYRKELTAAQGNVDAIINIKQKYRKAGLRI